MGNTNTNTFIRLIVLGTSIAGCESLTIPSSLTAPPLVSSSRVSPPNPYVLISGKCYEVLNTNYRRGGGIQFLSVSSYLDDYKSHGNGKEYSNPVLNPLPVTIPSGYDRKVYKKRGASPAIDSDLLRFLSKQSPATSTTTTPKPPLVSNEGSGLSSITPNNRYSNWINQFQVERVAQTLIASGANRDEAFVAGAAVQNHALERTRRRSLHKYMKDRDELWANFCGDDATSAIATHPNRESTESSSDHPEQAIALLMEAGCNGSDCAAILTHTPSVAMMRTHKRAVSQGKGESLEETVDRVVKGLLFSTLTLRKNEVRKVLRRCPRLLTVKGSHEAEQVITLLSSLGASPKSLVRDKRFLINVLTRSPTALFRVVAFLSSSSVCMRVQDIGSFLRKPGCCPDLLDALCPTVHSLRESGTGTWRHRVDKMYSKATRAAHVLRNDLGVDVAKVLPGYPGMLLLDPETQIYPVVEFLHHDLGLSAEDVPKVLQSFPALFKTDLEQMRETVEYLVELEVNPNSLAKIFRAFPAILSFDRKTKMEPVVTFLRDIGVINVGRFVTRLPSILGYSVEDNLLPKWNFLTRVVGLDYFDVVRFPAYFSYPMERIQARYAYLHLRGIPYRLTKLDSVLRFGDADFANIVARDEDGGKLYREYLKSGAQMNKTKKPKATKKKVSNRKTGAVSSKQSISRETETISIS